MAKRKRGYVSILGKKTGGMWISGPISSDGAKAFKTRRAELVALYKSIHGKAPATVSKANVIEYALRGHESTRALLVALKGA